jgi:hypothetical protein
MQWRPKGKSMTCKTLHRNLNIEQHEIHKNKIQGALRISARHNLTDFSGDNRHNFISLYNFIADSIRTYTTHKYQVDDLLYYYLITIPNKRLMLLSEFI